MAWTAALDENKISVGQLEAIKINDESIIVYRLDDGFYATQSRCTHLMAPLERGKIIDGYKIQCRFHRAEFNIRNGEVEQWACFPPGIQILNIVRKEKCLKTYACKVEKGTVYVDA